MTEFRRVPVHRGLTRQQLLAGCDRELFFLLAMFCGLLLMSGAARLYWRNVFLGVILWLLGVPALAKLAIYDAYFKGVVLRSTRYLRHFLPASGKLGQSQIRPVTHKRWD
jgi:type IV secretory pathway TrbD component